MKIYQNSLIYIEKENASIPWIKIFSQIAYKELSDCDEKTKNELLKAMQISEKSMLEFYKPDKINIAIFGNYLPHIHIHVMARFTTDSHFPESMWGKKQRETSLNLPNFDEFAKILSKNLEK